MIDVKICKHKLENKAILQKNNKIKIIGEHALLVIIFSVGLSLEAKPRCSLWGCASAVRARALLGCMMRKDSAAYIILRALIPGGGGYSL